MREIRLAENWQLDENRPLGRPGGFGAVFAGTGKDGKLVAVKRLHLEAQGYSSRELKIADFLLGHEHPHVIPILDVGFDSDSVRYYIVMARADQSLQDLVDRLG